MPSLPASVLNVMQSRPGSNRSLITSPDTASEQMALPFDYVVTGSYSLKITCQVRESRPVTSPALERHDRKLIMIQLCGFITCHAALRPAVCGLPRLSSGLLISAARQTRIWTQSEDAGFRKRQTQESVAAQRRPAHACAEFQEVYDTSSTYLWALGRDSEGNLYAGGGPGAKLYRLSASGEKKMVAELDGLRFGHGRRRARSGVRCHGAGWQGYPASHGRQVRSVLRSQGEIIWALAFDKAGDLLVATGDPGAVNRVTPDGHGSVLVPERRNAVRSMALDRQAM